MRCDETGARHTVYETRIRRTQGVRQTPGQPVVQFEIIDRDPHRLQGSDGALCGWSFAGSDAASALVSAPGHYRFLDGATTGEGDISGGVGGGR